MAVGNNGQDDQQLCSISFPLPSRIDHWDLEKERVVLLSDSNLISVKYNFILSAVESLKYIPLQFVSRMIFGDFKYTSSYLL